MAEINPEEGKGKVLAGQQDHRQDGYNEAFTEQVVKYSGPDDARVTGFEGQIGVEITPIDAASARVRIWDIAALTALLADVYSVAIITIPSISLPPTLTSLDVTYSTSTGAGADSHPASQQGFTIFGSGSGALNPSASAQGSASVTANVTPIIEEPINENVFAVEYTFWMPSTATKADILARISTIAGDTVRAWPQFVPEAITINATSEHVSLSAKADTHVSGGGTTDSGQFGFEYGNGYSGESSLDVKTLRISKTLHAAITIGDGSHSQDVSVQVDASTPLFDAEDDTSVIHNLPANQPISNIVTQVATATGFVTPTSISATEPAGVPTSGLHMKSLTATANFIANAMTLYQAVVINFADIQPI